MSDQATALRNLVERVAREHAERSAPAPRLLACLGGQPKLGCTTLAVNLAVALGRLGARVVLVDADLGGSAHRASSDRASSDRASLDRIGAGVAPACGLEPVGGDLSDVLCCRKELAEVLRRGPEGIQLVLALPGGELPSAGAEGRLTAQLRGLGRQADVVVLDLGSEITSLAAAGCRDADQVLLLTSPDSQAVMNTYALLKELAGHCRPEAAQLVVNRVQREAEGEDVYERMARSSREFLGLAVDHAGTIPLDSHVPLAASRARPCASAFPRCDAAVAVERLAARLWHRVGESPRSTMRSSPADRMSANRLD